MKFNAKIFKSKYFLYGVAGIVIFAILYRIASGAGGTASSGLTVIPGAAPSDAQNQAQLQATLAQLSASTNLQGLQLQSQRDILLGTLEAENKMAEIQAYADLQKYVTSAESNVAALTLQTQLEIAREQSDFGIATANTAAQTQVALREVDAAQFISQLTTNAAMFDSQLAANRDMFALQVDSQNKAALYQLAATAPKGGGLQRIQAVTGQPITPRNSSGFSNPVGVISPVIGIFG